MVVEVMGRHAGHIATWAGIAGGATLTLIPEEPFDIDEVCQAIERRHAGGRYATIVVVAEGAIPAPGTIDIGPTENDQYGHIRLGGIGNVLAAEIERRTGIETRVTILGHVQRGGTPSALDRVISTWFGVAAIDAVHDGAFGEMVSLRDGRVGRLPLDDAVAKPQARRPRPLRRSRRSSRPSSSDQVRCARLSCRPAARWSTAAVPRSWASWWWSSVVVVVVGWETVKSLRVTNSSGAFVAPSVFDGLGSPSITNRTPLTLGEVRVRDRVDDLRDGQLVELVDLFALAGAELRQVDLEQLLLSRSRRTVRARSSGPGGVAVILLAGHRGAVGASHQRF